MFSAQNRIWEAIWKGRKKKSTRFALRFGPSLASFLALSGLVCLLVIIRRGGTARPGKPYFIGLFSSFFNLITNQVFVSSLP